MAGFRFSKVDRIDMDDYEFDLDNQAEATKSVFNAGLYFGVNLGLDLIPKVVKTLF